MKSSLWVWKMTTQGKTNSSEKKSVIKVSSSSSWSSSPCVISRWSLSNAISWIFLLFDYLYIFFRCRLDWSKRKIKWMWQGYPNECNFQRFHSNRLPNIEEYYRFLGMFVQLITGLIDLWQSYIRFVIDSSFSWYIFMCSFQLPTAIFQPRYFMLCFVCVCVFD